MITLPPFITKLQQFAETMPVLRLGCTCETVNLITVLIHIAFLVLLIYLVAKFSSVRSDPFFKSLILGGILLVISETMDWLHILDVVLQRDLVFSHLVDFGVEGLQLVGLSIILIGLIRAWRKLS